MTTVRDVIANAIYGADSGLTNDGVADAILSALADSGFVVVPREPTEEMEEAGARATDYPPEGNADLHCARRVYQAMLAVAEQSHV